jgi:hypothetical protein
MEKTITVAQLFRQNRRAVRSCTPFQQRPNFPTGWNHQPLTESDFFRHCAAEGIEVHTWPMRKRGFCSTLQGIRIIILGKGMREDGHRSNFAFDTHEMTSHFRRTHFHLRDFASEIAVSPHAVRIGRYQAFCAAAA